MIQTIHRGLCDVVFTLTIKKKKDRANGAIDLRVGDIICIVKLQYGTMHHLQYKTNYHQLSIGNDKAKTTYRQLTSLINSINAPHLKTQK